MHNAACVRKDEKILARLLESYSEDEDPFANENGYHTKCYQKYTHKRLLEKLSKKPSQKAIRTSLRIKGRKGKNRTQQRAGVAEVRSTETCQCYWILGALACLLIHGNFHRRHC